MSDFKPFNTYPEDRADFLNRLRIMRSIDGWQLPELTKDEQRKFVDDPYTYFMRANLEQSNAIWREIEKRMTP